jgi:hypothetical protein
MARRQITVVHALPGRIRLKVAALSRNPTLAATIETRLQKVRGIHGVWASPRTGNVLVEFDPQTISHPESLQELSETLSRHFPALNPNRLEHCLMESMAGDPDSASSSAAAAGWWGGLARLRILIPVALLVFGLPKLWEN